MVLLISQNRISEPVPLIQQAGPYLQKSYGPLKLTYCVKNKDIAQSVAQR